MNNFEDKIYKYIDSSEMLLPGDGVIVGVSGGADSVCLLRILIEIREALAKKYGCHSNESLYLKVVHINHMIRGREADGDQQFVEELCRKLEIDFTAHKKDIPAMARENGLTEEEAGRLFRYECFEEEAWKLEQELCHIYELSSARNKRPDFLKNKAHFVRIAVAHNRNDLAETVIYNMIRGCSLTGLAGIKPVRGRIIRPLLMTERREIEDYLNTIGQDYVTDSTNLLEDYSRNKIRLGILPLLNEINDCALDHIVEIAGDSMRLSEDIDAEIHRTFSVKDYNENRVNIRTESVKVWNDEGEESEKEICDEISIEIVKLKNMGSFAAGELILRGMEAVCGRRKDITRKHINSIYELSDKESGKRVDLPYDMVAERIYDRIVIRNRMAENLRNERIIDEDFHGREAFISGSVSEDMISTMGVQGRVAIVKFPYSEGIDISKKEYTKMIDCDKINSVPVLRTMEEDDYIVINSGGGTKKLSRFFSAEKVERSLRKTIPVVADGNEIIWIVGYRLSERYKVTTETQTVMRMDYTSNKKS